MAPQSGPGRYTACHAGSSGVKQAPPTTKPGTSPLPLVAALLFVLAAGGGAFYWFVLHGG